MIGGTLLAFGSPLNAVSIDLFREIMKLKTAAAVAIAIACGCTEAASPGDFIRDIQTAAIENGKSPVAHWGLDPENYTQWKSHSLRLIPVYTYGTLGGGPGVDLTSYIGENSAYRTEDGVRAIYGRLPTNTVNPRADYGDQTNVADLQRAAAAAGKKYIFLVIFDGTDWQTTQAAAIYHSGRVGYTEGRGTGLHWLDYTAGGTSQYGYVVTAPSNDGTKDDVNTQTVTNPGGAEPGGYNAEKAGNFPWSIASDRAYIHGKTADDKDGEHPYPDSAGTATACCSGVKTYNAAIGVDVSGAPVSAVAHELQQRGWAIGVVTSVPISHATPAAAYAHNVARDDYQDLTRDLLGLPSIMHPDAPLAGVDVLIGGGYGQNAKESKGQGTNFVPGNVWITDADRTTIDVAHGGRYVVAERTVGRDGSDVLSAAAEQAAGSGHRLFGFFGLGQYGGHLPFQTADGDYNPTRGVKAAEQYSAADLSENPTLAEMTAAAITVLSRDPDGFWMMVESGDVDWANHDDNLDNSIGAVLSGDEAIKVITDWVEAHSNWDESLLIVTSDHGHDLNLLQPEALTGDAAHAASRSLR